MFPHAALVAALLAFASSVSGLPVPPDAKPPRITLSATSHGRPLGVNEPEAGITDIVTGSIDLYPEWGRLRADNCLLAHELTHYLQAVNGVAFRMTPEARERQAYRVTRACFMAYRGMEGEVQWATMQIRHPHVIH